MGLAQADPVSFCDHLLRHASSGGVVSKAVFSQCVAEFAPRCGEGAEAARHAVVRRIFRLFDAANDDAVDALELAAGVTALCGGSRDRKVSAVLGADGRTLLSLPQLASYFYAIFRVLCDAQCESEDSSGESTDDDAASLALATAEQCFAELRPAGGACICVDEFRAWYEASGGAAEDAAVDDAASAEGAASSGGSGALGALRNAAGLGAYDVHHVSEMFRNVRCDRVDRNAFHECLGALRLNAVAPALLGADSARDVFEYVYDALDAAHAGLNKAELVVGLSILCRGSARARVREALDVLGEGEAVSYDAAHAYLRAVFRFVFSLKSDKGAGGGPDADAVARQTAARAFTDSGVATDEDLDVKVFADWYAANVRLAEPGAPFRAPQQQALHECIEAVALRAGVAGQAVHVATQRVFSAADARGTLDRRAFSQALQCDGETAEDTRKLFDCIRTKTSTRVRSGVPAAALRPPRGAW
ncbi:hypothetical protein M885DRAFT_508180 [Pelagophyceae sp. CCMP2097]|nr:hypothetical protein M885DRAFT_508180 [Pelagophyceae sp. CCMP2097]|mmetsp:Transcript_19717/g.67918  ORF Transcript_19717/g.67918 Transcript_19717/m.67918 type:complete len:476 (-) Transcript_19717:269-1696(-)